MKDKRITYDNYIHINGFMRIDLDLKGNELLLYALIYGFTQAENQVFTGSLQYISDFLGISKQAVQETLKRLLDKGLIAKSERYFNGIKYVEYKTLRNNFNGIQESCIPYNLNGSQESCTTIQENCTGMQESCIPKQESCTNNNINNNINNNKIKNKENIKEKLFDDFWKVYPRKVSKQEAIKSFNKIENIEKVIPKIIRAVVYLKSTEQWQEERFIPHPTTFINQRRWEDVESKSLLETFNDEWNLKVDNQKRYTDEELEQWHYETYGERVKYKNGIVVKE